MDLSGGGGLGARAVPRTWMVRGDLLAASDQLPLTPSTESISFGLLSTSYW